MGQKQRDLRTAISSHGFDRAEPEDMVFHSESTSTQRGALSGRALEPFHDSLIVEGSKTGALKTLGCSALERSSNEISSFTPSPSLVLTHSGCSMPAPCPMRNQIANLPGEGRLRPIPPPLFGPLSVRTPKSLRRSPLPSRRRPSGFWMGKPRMSRKFQSLTMAVLLTKAVDEAKSPSRYNSHTSEASLEVFWST